MSRRLLAPFLTVFFGGAISLACGCAPEEADAAAVTPSEVDESDVPPPPGDV